MPGRYEYLLDEMAEGNLVPQNVIMKISCIKFEILNIIKTDYINLL